MQVRIEDVSPVEKKMFVEVPWETVSQKLGDAYRELGKGVALKGFRKGKVPRPVLEQVYGPRINAEVATQLVRESFFRASEQHKLAPVAEPRVEEAAPIKKGQPFTFAA
ncbi:MAG: trigger factor family protein, partial [bacterium]